MLFELKRSDFEKLSADEKWKVVETLQMHIYKLRCEIQELEEVVSIMEQSTEGMEELPTGDIDMRPSEDGYDWENDKAEEG